MDEVTHYSKPPIIEAIIDVRILNKEPQQVGILEQLVTNNKDRYPKIVPVQTAKLNISLNNTPDKFEQSQSFEQIGVSVFNPEGNYMCQLRLDGITTSRRAPYESWVKLLSEFQEMWAQYAEVIKPETITRVGVRYINIFDLPLPFKDFREYILTTPEVAPNLPQGLSGFLMQLHIPKPEIGAMLIINESLIPPRRENVVSLVLDIDLFQDKIISGSLWEVLEILHINKNEVFEACMTERARELIR
jgi:uncharacterized protein (TIGR04255 family)